ncbi:MULTISPECIES: ATP-binding protein [Corallococcus]|uniref:hybrid sensor histidine kinase/response regulator n=1 Tax=Corallococcus TaxID=83461 RepID=UPI0011806C02|nr:MULTISPECIES: ATP-binding protein [Corallococcus]NBD09747.1 response regulator [Corallococcus silvisoli]TSC24021.1 response regulator [Corallococcus sp. Z5C101001]
MTPIRLLLVEDSANDAALVTAELELAGYLPTARRVETLDGLRAALATEPWDLVLCDYRLPRFTALEALGELRARERDVPLIVLSSQLSEEQAVTLMKAGARDCFSKDRLARLGPAVARELEETRVRRERARAEEDRDILAKASELLTASLEQEARLDQLVQLVVPRVADWSAFFLQDAGRGALRLVALAHPDLERRAQAWRLDQRFPLDPRAAAGPSWVVRTGQPEFVPDVRERPEPITQDPAHQRAIDGFGLRSVVNVPLPGREGVLGVLSVGTLGERTLGPVDLALAQELARRTGLVLENARLFQEAREAVRLRDEFLTVAAHELRTPLTTLRLQLGTLLQRSDAHHLEPDVVTRLERSVRQVRRLGTLVEGLLDVSQLSSGELSLMPERFDLEELVAEVLERHQAEARAAGCELRQSARRGLWGTWDRLRVDQAVGALISNALKFGPGRPVEVDVGREGGFARIQVRDRGIGVPVDQVERIFERFGRAVSSHSYGGLGLGLYLARRAAEAHGGRAWAEPGTAEGARFTLELPLEKETRE